MKLPWEFNVIVLCIYMIIKQQLQAVSTEFLPIVDLSDVTEYMKYNKNNNNNINNNNNNNNNKYRYYNATHLDFLLHKKGFEMGKALGTYGFLYITGHGIDPGLISHSFQTSKDFFVDRRNFRIHKQYRRRKDVLLGYVDGHNEADFPDRPPDLKQAYDIVQNSSEFNAIPNPTQTVLSKLWTSLQETSRLVLQLLAVSAGQARDYYLKAHQHVGDIDENSSTLRLCHYPYVKDPVRRNQSRISEHTDFGTFTMLLQDNVGGLEALSPEGEYKEVRPIANAIVLNVGDLLQLWSNHFFRSTVHRVVAKQQGVSARQSIVFFTNPDNKHVINSLYGSKSVLDHINERNNSTVFDN